MVLLGTIMPFIVALLGHRGVDVSKLILFFGAVGQFICGLSLTYVILKGGAYSPLIPVSSYEE